LHINVPVSRATVRPLQAISKNINPCEAPLALTRPASFVTVRVWQDVWA
jgi:hypothetical protein